MIYDSSLPDHRRLLGEAIVSKLLSCGFVEVTAARSERVFVRDVPNTGKAVKVYTTVTRGATRGNGKDAIRVSGVYSNRNGFEAGLVKNTRINRVGTIDAIVDRMYKRMRETYRKLMVNAACGCGAPKFVSSRGNSVCAEFCWKN